MKNPIPAVGLLLMCLLCLLQKPLHAQDVIRIQPCLQPTIAQQVDSLKKKYHREGFVVLKEAFIQMESEYEMPVIVPLQQGGWYEFVFIGEPTSRLYEVRMYDWSEKQVVYKKHMWGDVDGNIINFSYNPRFSEYYMIKPVQVHKKDKSKPSLCGHVMLLRRTQDPSKLQTSR